MAIQNPSNLFSGGAVVFNSNPYNQFAINMMARKAAKDEALDAYYRDLNKSINPAGVRTQDINGFMEKTNALQNYWQQNKDAIKNPRLDNGRSQTEYNSRYQDIQGYINQSKQAELAKKPFVGMLADPDKRERITPYLMHNVALHDLPLNDVNRKNLDITDDGLFNPKELSTKDWQDYYNNVGKDVKVDSRLVTSPDPNDRFSNIVTTVQEYSPEKLKAIGDIAKNDYLTNNSLQYSFDKNHHLKEYKDEHSSEYERLNTIYKGVYGDNIKDEGDLHAAIVLSKKIEPTLTPKSEPNWRARDDYNFAQQKELEGIRFAHQQALAKLRKSLGLKEDGSDDDGLWIDGYVTNKINEGKPAQYYDDATKTWVKAKEISLDPISEESLKVNGQSPDFVYVMPDNRIKYGIYRRETDKQTGKPTGNFIIKDGKKSVDMTNVRTISQAEFKASIGKSAGVKQFNKEMSSTKQSQKGELD